MQFGEATVCDVKGAIVGCHYLCFRVDDGQLARKRKTKFSSTSARSEKSRLKVIHVQYNNGRHRKAEPGQMRMYKKRDEKSGRIERLQ